MSVNKLPNLHVLNIAELSVVFLARHTERAKTTCFGFSEELVLEQHFGRWSLVRFLAETLADHLAKHFAVRLVLVLVVSSGVQRWRVVLQRQHQHLQRYNTEII